MGVYGRQFSSGGGGGTAAGLPDVKLMEEIAKELGAGPRGAAVPCLSAEGQREVLDSFERLRVSGGFDGACGTLRV